MKVSGSEYLLDTNIIVDFFKGDSNVIEQLSVREIFVPSIVVGELYFGAYASSFVNNQAKRLSEIAYFVEKYTVLKISRDTSDHYGRIKAQLKAMGTPIPENDIWIAALAKEHNLEVVTRDQHFAQIPDLQILEW